MRFVSPETVRIDLSNGQWIEVKKDLSSGEDKRFRAAGFRGLSQVPGENGTTKQEIGVDWQALAYARTMFYLTDWSARDAKDKPVMLSRQALEDLSQEDFDEIDVAIQAHIAAREDEKKQTASTKKPGPSSLSAA